QLHSTVSQYGVTSEPIKQMLDYLWDSQLLLPADCRGIARLIFTQHQQLRLQPSTSRSLNLDLAAAVDVTLMTPHPQKVPTGIKGQAMGALFLGRPSASMLGLFIIPGVIDVDYTGEIMIMVYTPFPPIQINKGQRIAQLVPLEQITKDLPSTKDYARGTDSFGSTGGLTLLILDLSERPKRKVEVEYQGQKCSFMGLLDTGEDSSIIAPHCWPQHWPLQPAATMVTGVGGLTLASCS
ncbi:POK9 protein, partial [Emberiza fucata]|nr:POK9 protein [Emberiza fucata]